MKFKQHTQKRDKIQGVLSRTDERFKRAFIGEIKSNYPIVLKESTIMGCFPELLSVEIYFFHGIITESFLDVLFDMVKRAFRKALLPTINTLCLRELGWIYSNKTKPGTITFLFEIFWVEISKEIYVNGSREEVHKKIIFYIYNLCAQRQFLYDCYERILSSCKIPISEEFFVN